MKKILYSSVVVLIVILLTGCSSILDNNQGVFGNAQKQVGVVDTNIRHIENAKAQANEDTLDYIGAWAKGGVEYSLDQIKTNVPPEVITAKQMNERIEALAGQPDFNKVKEIENIVNNLLAQTENVRKSGEKELAAKDKEITQIKDTAKQLDKQREDEIAKAFAQANVNARAADQYKSTLNQMDSWFGLGAVFYGIKKFVVSSMWILGIGGIVFLILRLLASSNPFAAAIFEVFSRIGSWFINMIELIVPKAAEKAGQTATTIFNSTESALKSIVDSVETVKLQANTSGTPATIQDLLNTAELSMTTEDKAIIEKIKLELGWVKPSTKPTTIVLQSAPSPTAASPVTTTVVVPPPTAPIVSTSSTIPLPVVPKTYYPS